MKLYLEAFLGYYHPSRRAGLRVLPAVLNAFKLAVRIGK